jgi:hypothetical protein
VQYIEDELEIFEGVQQFAKGTLSTSTARYFLYNTVTDGPIFVSLKSITDTKYRIVGRLASWKEYLNTNGTLLYPTFNDEQQLYADTNSLGSTALVIRKSDLIAKDNSSDLLLISVFANNVVDTDVDFKIEATQTMAKLSPSETKMGYVDKD